MLLIVLCSILLPAVQYGLIAGIHEKNFKAKLCLTSRGSVLRVESSRSKFTSLKPRVLNGDRFKKKLRVIS